MDLLLIFGILYLIVAIPMAIYAIYKATEGACRWFTALKDNTPKMDYAKQYGDKFGYLLFQCAYLRQKIENDLSLSYDGRVQELLKNEFEENKILKSYENSKKQYVRGGK